MSAIALFHDRVYSRRVRVLSRQLADLLPDDVSVLDVGCGDGLIGKLVMELRPDVSLEGIDVRKRVDTHIPVREFDGTTIPYGDNSIDVVSFVDVLHHTEDPTVLLREARRVAREYIVLKDHTRDGFLADPTLRFMDWVGNARHGVVLPYNYWPSERWRTVLAGLGLGIDEWIDRVGLYPPPANLLFGRSLHFVARLGLDSRTV